jgi:hypothetical protein
MSAATCELLPVSLLPLAACWATAVLLLVAGASPAGTWDSLLASSLTEALEGLSPAHPVTLSASFRLGSRVRHRAQMRSASTGSTSVFQSSTCTESGGQEEGWWAGCRLGSTGRKRVLEQGEGTALPAAAWLHGSTGGVVPEVPLHWLTTQAVSMQVCLLHVHARLRDDQLLHQRDCNGSEHRLAA